MTEEAMVPHDIVYIGKRLGAGGKMILGFQLLNENGSFGECLFYAYDRKMDRTIGAVYTGAEFANDQSRGIASANFVKMWDNRDDRIMWQAKNDQIEAIIRNTKLEKDAGKISDIEKIMLPLRKQYDTLRVRHDHAGQEALERSVLRALRSSPRSTE